MLLICGLIRISYKMGSVKIVIATAMIRCRLIKSRDVRYRVRPRKKHAHGTHSMRSPSLMKSANVSPDRMTGPYCTGSRFVHMVKKHPINQIRKMDSIPRKGRLPLRYERAKNNVHAKVAMVGIATLSSQLG